MAHPESSPPNAASRAIKIPHHDPPINDFPSPARHRRRGGKFSRIPQPVENSEAGPSSMGSESSDSSYSPSSSLRAAPFHRSRDPQASQIQAESSLRDEIKFTAQRKDKAKASDLPPTSTLPLLFQPASSPLGASMLSSSSYKSINLNDHYDPNEPPRLITYTQSSQGFTWNDELFLPSYMIGRYSGRGRRKLHDNDFGEDDVPITEIFVTDEEAAAMMP